MKTKVKYLIKKYGISIAILVTTLLIINPSHWYVLDLAQSFIPHIMLGFVMLGIALFWWKKDHVAIPLLLAGFVLFLFLQPYMYLGNADKAKKNESADLKVAHFNILKINTFYNATIDKAKATEADLLSFQEVTSKWATALENGLCEDYPYYQIVASDTSSFGIAVFSKHPLKNLETIYWEELPNIAGDIDLADSSIHFLASHTSSPTTKEKYNTRRKHIRHIANYLKKFDKPVLAIGDYNVVPWNASIVSLRNQANLADSRTSLTATYPSYLRAVGIPIDYIFHSPEIKCLSFQTIHASGSDHLGIVGAYQIAKTSSSI